MLAAGAGFARAGARGIEGLSLRDRRLHDIALLRGRLAEACERTLSPRWAPSKRLVGESGGLYSVGYLDGAAEKLWTLRVEPGRVGVELDGGSAAAAVENAGASLITRDDRVVGIELAFDALGRRWTWREYFGAPGS